MYDRYEPERKKKNKQNVKRKNNNEIYKNLRFQKKNKRPYEADEEIEEETKKQRGNKKLYM